MAGDYISVNDILDAKNPLPTVVAAEPRQPQWRVSAGAVWRDVGDVKFRTGSRSQILRLPNLVGQEFRHLPTDAGQLGRIDFRDYEDGYVRADAGTLNDDYTWNWGYQQASQVQGDLLVYSLQQGSQLTMSRHSSLSDASWRDDNDFEAGPYIEIERLFPITQTISIGPQFNFSFIGVDQQHSGSTFSQQQASEERSFLLTDRFELDGIIPPLAPYEGSPTGPGPLINNVPSQRQITDFRTGSGTADFFNRVDESFDLDLSTLGIGGQVEYDLGMLFVQGSAGLTLNVADWEASHRETLYISRNGGKAKDLRSWSAHESDTDLLVGAYVQAKLGVQLSERVSVSGFARYDWSQSLSGDVGPSSFDVDLDGLSAGVMIGVTF
jgi:hypothetical protein